MQREFLEKAKQAIDEGWDAFKIMAEFIAIQKEQDAQLAETLGAQSIADAIRQQ